MRRFIAMVSVFLPWHLKKIFLQAFLDFSFGTNCYIGISLIFPKKLEMSSGARIGHLTICKGLDHLAIGEDGYIGHLNWITGFPSSHCNHFEKEINRFPALLLGEHAAITNRHLIDCTDTVRIGKFSTFAGFRSQILTHSIDFQSNRQACAPVDIGQYCFIGTQCVLLKGSKLPDRCVLSAGSVLTKQQIETDKLYSGNPAIGVQAIKTENGYFIRTKGFVN